jgi:hypothetical protein
MTPAPPQTLDNSAQPTVPARPETGQKKKKFFTPE